tara:strand:+ start:56 stop:376 length:321 start_codon:yes stop_codon:yes gene_type:complete
VLEKKKRWPSLILAILSWLGLSWLIYSYSPHNLWTFLLFFFLVFSAVFFTSAFILINSRRGLLFSFLIILILIFRYFQIGNLLNISLLLAILVIIELYLKDRKKTD